MSLFYAGETGHEQTTKNTDSHCILQTMVHHGSQITDHRLWHTADHGVLRIIAQGRLQCAANHNIKQTMVCYESQHKADCGVLYIMA